MGTQGKARLGTARRGVAGAKKSTAWGGTSAPHALRGSDLYETPPEATRALLNAEAFRPNGVIWEPACGRGAIADVLARAGFEVIASDLNEYGFGRTGVDFLKTKVAPAGVDAIITNPPYILAAEFARHALTLVDKVAFLLRLSFLESVRRSDILDDGRLRRVLIFRNRLPMMHRDGLPTAERKLKSGTVAYAWFIWSNSSLGDTRAPRIYRLTWK